MEKSTLQLLFIKRAGLFDQSLTNFKKVQYATAALYPTCDPRKICLLKGYFRMEYHKARPAARAFFYPYLCTVAF